MERKKGKPRSALAITAMLLMVASAACLGCIQDQGGGDDREGLLRRIRDYVGSHNVEVLREFIDFLSIPNVSGDRENIARNADFIMEMMRRRGIVARLLTVQGASPVVFGSLEAPDAEATILVYAHYDGQPVAPEKWAGDPWKPILRDKPLEDGGREVELPEPGTTVDGEWRLYARSAADDKAPIIAWMAALDALEAVGARPSVNLKFIFEGEEEAGSDHLPRIIAENKGLLEADALLLCDGPVHQSRRMQVFFGARGIVGVEITVYGPKVALHSGHYGNWAPNPGALMASLLASMRDGDGRILIDGFNDDVRELSEAERAALAAVPDADEELRNDLELAWSEGGNARLVERIMLPAMNVRGLQCGEVGEKAKNAVPTEARASVGFRLVPDQTPGRVRELVEAHIRNQGFFIVHEPPSADIKRNNPRVIYLAWEQGYRAARTPIELPICSALLTVLERATGGELIALPNLGGSVPIYLFEDLLGIPTIGLPIVNHDNNQHAPNENLRLRNLWDGIEINAVIAAGLGEVFKPSER